MAKAGRGDDQYMLRFPDGMRDRLKSAAKKNGRSLNSEIVSRLELGLERDINNQIALRLPEDLYNRIWEYSNLSDVDIEKLIVDALSKHFPPPTMSLGQIVERIRLALSYGNVTDEKARRELTEYLKGAEALILAEPDAQHISITLGETRGGS